MKKLLIIALLLFLSCGIFSPETGICVESEYDSGFYPVGAWTYDCYEGKSEDSCYGAYYDDKTCSEFCENRTFCDIH